MFGACPDQAAAGGARSATATTRPGPPARPPRTPAARRRAGPSWLSSSTSGRTTVALIGTIARRGGGPVQAQDSSDPTGVAKVDATLDQRSLRRARARKANAAIQMKLAGATWDEVARALGY